jgi:hypothetical protein
MRRSTELVLMIVGCAALVIAAILLPALLLTPPGIEQPAKAPAPSADALGPSAVEPARLPSVSQLVDPPMPRAVEPDKEPDQLAGRPRELTQPPGPPDSTGTINRSTPGEGAAPGDQSAKTSDQVVALAPNEPKDAARLNAQTSDMSTRSDSTKPSDQVAMSPPAEPREAAKRDRRAAPPAPNTASVAAEPSDQTAARMPSEPTKGSGTDPKMPAVESPSSEIGAPPEADKPPDKVAAIKPDEPTDTGRGPGDASPARPGRKSVRVRTPWWCSNPRGEDVVAVCGNRELLALDAELNALYSRLMAREQNAELRDAQRQWLVRRQSCGADIRCLKRHYENRIDELARM